MAQYIVLGTTSDRKAQAFGTKTGQPFQTEKQADKAMAILDKQVPHVNFLVLPLAAYDYEAKEFLGIPEDECPHRKLLSGYCRAAGCPNNIKNHMH